MRPASLWLSLACSPALSGSLLLALALSGSLLLSEFAYNILARLTRPLLSSQRRCCAATLYAGLPRHTLCIIHTTPYQTRTFRCTRATYIPPICQCESENFFPQMLLIPCPNRSHLSSCCSLQLFTSSDSMSTLQLM